MKKFFAIILSVIIACSLSVSIFAQADSDECNCGCVPVVFVTGFAYTELVANAGTEDEYGAFGVETEAITDMVKKLILPLFALVLTGNYDSFAHKLSSEVNTLFYDASCDVNGNPNNPTVDIELFDEPEAYHPRGEYSTFRYDWRKDVFDVAAELNDYIEQVKVLTGHSKVAIRAESMGGAVTMAYLYTYGYDSIDTVVMQSSAFDGIDMMTSLFVGDLSIDAKSVLNYVGNFLEGNSVDMVFYRALYRTFALLAFNPVVTVLDEALISKIKDVVYEDCIKSLFGYIPGLWVFVAEDSYEEAKEFMLDEDVNSVLIEKIDKYHYEVMNRKEEIIRDAMANGVNFAIISNYGKAAVPLGVTSTNQSDFLIDTMHTSFGATCADYGETLGDGYVQQINDGHDHLSPDNVIDASTCEFPEITWFVKDMMHTWYTDGYHEFVNTLIHTPGQETIHTFEQYPQFLVNNQETEALEPMTEDNMDTQSTDIDYIGLFELIVKKVQE